MNIYQQGGIKYGNVSKELTLNRPIVDKNNFSTQIGKDKTQINRELKKLKDRVLLEKQSEKQEELENYRKAKNFHENNPLAFFRKKQPSVLPENTWKESLDNFGSAIEDFYKVPSLGIANDFINPLHLVSSGIISPIASSFKQSEDIDNYYEGNPKGDPLFINKSVDRYVPYGLAGLSTAMTAPFIKPSVNFLKGTANIPKEIGKLYRDVKYPTNTINFNNKVYHNSDQFLRQNKFNNGLNKKQIKFLNNELKDRGILEYQRRNPLDIRSKFSKKTIIPEDYNIKNTLINIPKNLYKGQKYVDAQYTMGDARKNAFNQYLGIPTKNTAYRVHSQSFKNGNPLTYTIPDNLVNRESSKEPLYQLTHNEVNTMDLLTNYFKEPNNTNKKLLFDHLKPQYPHIEDLKSYSSFKPENLVSNKAFDYGKPIIGDNKTVIPSWDYITGTGGGAPFIKEGNKVSLKDTWDIQPFSRYKKLPSPIRNLNGNIFLGGKDFNMLNTYDILPNKIKQTF